jgi:hypothetical protein
MRPGEIVRSLPSGVTSSAKPGAPSGAPQAPITSMRVVVSA